MRKRRSRYRVRFSIASEKLPLETALDRLAPGLLDAPCARVGQRGIAAR
jgi:hypothetical protein